MHCMTKNQSSSKHYIVSAAGIASSISQTRSIGTISSMASMPIASPPFLIMISLIMLLLTSCSEAREFLVGGSEDSWKVPLPSPDSLNQWAKTQHFTIGDALIFKYDNETESVHVVNERDYAICNPVGNGKHKVFNDGNTKVFLRSSGAVHFISGDKGHCQMGLKLTVVVMSSGHDGASSHSPSPSPSPHALASSNQGVAGTSEGGLIRVMMGLGLSFLMMMVFFII